MAKTGVEVPKLPDTGVDPELHKAHLNAHSEQARLSAELYRRLIDYIFSANTLVFIVALLVIASGFYFMSREGMSKSDIVEFWKLILPAMTTYMGYAIGKGKGGSATE